ncbi:enterotoxin [Opitutus sp. ER46]|uniref:enterotoxin n=1 Tax=Opitutus sp. ER46 TaxID=2161864 RepID=UPI000D30A8FC|nr:enterotoxin [Opitutus sp. ER46]PTX96548.1 enterotoxin [Opitutus sp. ER46]
MPLAKSLLLYVLTSVAILAASAAESAAAFHLDAKAFSLGFADGRVVRSADLRATASGSASAQRYVSADGAFSIAVATTTVDTPAVTYTRTRLTLTNTGTADLPLTQVVMVDTAAAADVKAAGDVNGSPLVAGRTFFGVEHPLARNTVNGGKVQCLLPVMQPLRAGETLVASFVFGTAPDASQLRRAFLAYIERERPRPYAPFLHHNTWYNLGYGNTFSEAQELALIATVGRELVAQRGVKLDGFVLDDGWDDTHSLWRFHAGWPNGLKAMAAATARFGASPGIWLSPWGGYQEAKAARIAAAAPEGFEIRDGSFSLAGPRYYERFRELCAAVVRDNGVAYFKFDGIGPKKTGMIDPAAGRDFDAMLRLVAELRGLKPGLYVSQTTGTWASPFWLLHVDNIWRGGRDHSFAGVGTDRQQWLTYRDAETFKNVVQRGPLFPLNSVMNHGVIYAKLAKKLGTAEGSDFRDEVRSYFGCGTQLQELYLSPELLSTRDWDDIAAAAKWARRQATILRDTHWIGGDPARLEPYGWAAWSPDAAVITLRNPAAQPAEFLLDAQIAFELPRGARSRFHVISPYADAPAPITELHAGKPARISLRPFEVLVLEATPER